MKCMILCAGYGSDLLENEKGIPSTLLQVTKKETILDYILHNVEKIEDIDEVLIATNNRYYQALKSYQENKKYSKTIKVINDTTHNRNECLGAVGDIEYLINDQNIEEDVLIILGDNLFTCDLKPMVEQFKQKKDILVAVQEEKDKRKLVNLGVIEINEEKKIVDFDERSRHPKSNLKSLGIYLFPKEVLPYIRKYLEEGNRTETPGYLLAYLYNRISIFVYLLEGFWFDINTDEELRQIRSTLTEENTL